MPRLLLCNTGLIINLTGWLVRSDEVVHVPAQTVPGTVRAHGKASLPHLITGRVMVPTALTPGMALGFPRHSLEAAVAAERGAEGSGVRPNGMRWPFLMCYFYSFYKSVEKSLFFIQPMNRLNSTISTNLPLFPSSFLLVSQGFPYGITDAFLSSLLRTGRTS